MEMRRFRHDHGSRSSTRGRRTDCARSVRVVPSLPEPPRRELPHPVRDGHGHLVHALRGDAGVLAAIGGDEFLLLTEGVATVADAVALADRLVKLLARPFEVDGRRVRVSASIGVVVWHQLRQDDLVDRIERALRRHGLEPTQLLCEVTESVAMGGPDTLQRVFDGLARIGVFISIDDFSTGYSSLVNLRQLRAAQLKIDRSFINDIETNKDAFAIVGAVVDLAHSLDWFMGNKPDGGVDFSPSAIMEDMPA
jgi:predicted signal transduction protein with EAL and GGDEF domain